MDEIHGDRGGIRSSSPQGHAPVASYSGVAFPTLDTDEVIVHTPILNLRQGMAHIVVLLLQLTTLPLVWRVRWNELLRDLEEAEFQVVQGRLSHVL